MRYQDEYRDGETARLLSAEIASRVTRPWVLMEVCGGQTHAIVRDGIDEMLPPQVELVHGPGCPVCVTPLELIDRAHAIAAQPDVIFCSFGDMLRVPGSDADLFSLKARGADIRVVYSPLDALALASAHPRHEVVFFAIGFETTAPANAMAVWLAHRRRIPNFSVLVSQVRVPPAITAILEAPDNRVQGFLGPGHVCSVMGVREYEQLSGRFRVPIVITGFEPVDILWGVRALVAQLEGGRFELENGYGRAVPHAGNARSQAILDEVFEVCDRSWRGIGAVPAGGYALRAAYRDFDAVRRFAVEGVTAREPRECISGRILRGLAKPTDCPAFGGRCTPDTPLGATMVSSEGACAAYHAHGRAKRIRSLPLTPRGVS